MSELKCWKCGQAINFGSEAGVMARPQEYAHAKCPDTPMKEPNVVYTNWDAKCEDCNEPIKVGADWRYFYGADGGVDPTKYKHAKCPEPTQEYHNQCRECGKTFWTAEAFCPICRAHDEPMNTETEPSLSLLVVDFGNFTLIKAEKGDGTILLDGITYSCTEGNFETIQLFTFGQVKAAIDASEPDAEKPLPRIEREGENHLRFYTNYSKHPTSGGSLTYTLNLDDYAYEALCQLAGTTIPIWEPRKGVWKQIDNGHSRYKVWEYKR